jgi:hypothetical protein
MAFCGVGYSTRGSHAGGRASLGHGQEFIVEIGAAIRGKGLAGLIQKPYTAMAKKVKEALAA